MFHAGSPAGCMHGASMHGIASPARSHACRRPPRAGGGTQPAHSLRSLCPARFDPSLSARSNRPLKAAGAGATPYACRRCGLRPPSPHRMGSGAAPVYKAAAAAAAGDGH